MEYLYINPDTKELFYPVHIHNFYKNEPAKVRIMGNSKLNPDDKNYPDKKVVNVSDLKEVTKAEFSPETIEANSF